MDTEELLEKWLESIKTQVKDRTLFVYKSIIRLHILPKLGKYKLSELSGRDMQDFVISLHSKSNPRTGKCLSSNMIAMIFSVLKASFNYAVFNEYLRINPCIGVKKGKNISKKVEAFSKHEQTILENYCKENSKYFGVFLTLYTGIRIGELLGLTWSDFDEKNKLIKINKTAYTIKDEKQKWIQKIDAPKTMLAVREIPLSNQVLRLLLKHKKLAQGEYIINNKSNMMSIRNYQKKFKNLLKRLNIEPKGFHSLRHTFATRAIEAGIDIKTLSELLGHSKASITINRYVHTDYEKKKKAIDILSKNLIK